MPVKGLERFSESKPGVLVNVNLKELIKEELSSTGVRPNIIVDGSSFPFLFNEEESSFVFSQPAVTKMKIENFFEKLTSYGANVIVVLRGSIRKSPDKWFARQKPTLVLIKRKYEGTTTLKKPEEIYYKSVNSASNFCCIKTLASISNEHYRVFTSVNGTAEEIANTAVKEKCLAVLGQDSNYLIYEGIRFYIPLKSLDIETFNCKFYDKNELLKCLGLNSCQLPMFATLCGNDIVPYDTMRHFHARISNPLLPEFLLDLAQKVRHTSNDPYMCVQEMVNLISLKQVTKNLIEQSLDMYLKYKEIQPVKELIKFAVERARKCDWSYKLYRIFVDKQIYSNRLTDICNVGLTTFQLLRPLRRKLYGILLPSSEQSVEEYFLEEMALNKCSRPIPKTTFKISKGENSVIELFGNRTVEMNLSRWELFLSCVSDTLSFSEIRIVPESYLFPVMALHFMHVSMWYYFPEKKIYKQQFKVEAFLLGVLLFKEFPRERLENIEASKPDLWELQLHTLYLDVCFTLNLLNEACGFVIPKQKACVCSFYDGKLTHWIYDSMKRGATCDDFFRGDVVLEALFYTLMDVIKTEN